MKTIISWLTRVTARVTAVETEQAALAVDFSALAAATPEVITKTTGTTAVTVDQANSDVILTNTGAGGAITFTLPEATAGMRVTAVVKAAQPITLAPATGEALCATTTNVKGTDDYGHVADAIGEYIKLVCVKDGLWDVHGYLGTWTLTDLS